MKFANFEVDIKEENKKSNRNEECRSLFAQVFVYFSTAPHSQVLANRLWPEFSEIDHCRVFPLSSHIFNLRCINKMSTPAIAQ